LSAHRRAIAGAVFLMSLTGVGMLALPVAMDWHNVQDLESAVRHPPSWTPVMAPGRFLSPRDQSSHKELVWRLAHRPVSWFGHDDLGRSLFYRLVLGFLISLAIGIGSAALAVGIGTSWGAVAAYAGGRTDLILMRIVDVLYGLPYTLVAILLEIALSGPLTVLMGEDSKAAQIVILFLAIGGVSWPTMARVVRGQVLSLRHQPFVEAARALGAGPLHILRRHLLPNLVGTIVVYASLVVPQAILQESFLSFLGIGIQQPLPSLGRLAADGVHAVNTFVSFWWLLVFPCGMLGLTLLALNFIGDGLRDALDPKSSAGLLS